MSVAMRAFHESAAPEKPKRRRGMANKSAKPSATSYRKAITVSLGCGIPCLSLAMSSIGGRYDRSHGHFGRELEAFTWEKTDKAETLRRAVGLAAA